MKRKEMPNQTGGIEQMSLTMQSMFTPKSVISYKEYKALKEVEQGASTANISTPEEEEDWDAEPSLQPWDTPPGANFMAHSQEDEWKQMIDQDPCLGLITGDSGHDTMTATEETESIKDVEELTGAIGGINKSAYVEYLSDVDWRDDDPLFVFNDDDVTKPQTLTTASTPI